MAAQRGEPAVFGGKTFEWKDLGDSEGDETISEGHWYYSKFKVFPPEGENAKWKVTTTESTMFLADEGVVNMVFEQIFQIRIQG